MKRHLLSILCAGLLASVAVAGESPRADGSIVADATAPSVQIKVKAHGVEVTVDDDESRDVTVYAITGQIVKHLQIPGASTTLVELSPGCYIVRVDGLSRRVVVN